MEHRIMTSNKVRSPPPWYIVDGSSDDVCENNNTVISDRNSKDIESGTNLRERLDAGQYSLVPNEEHSKIFNTRCSGDYRRTVQIWSSPHCPRYRSLRQQGRILEHASSNVSSPRPDLEKMNCSMNTSFDDSVFYSEHYEEVLETTRGLCRDYICYRLKRSGYQGRVVITKYLPAQDQNLSFDILKIGKTFEALYPHLFRNLARQLGYVLKSEHELRLLFDRLASNIIGADPGDYTWARVLGLFGIAGALSVDCMAQGHCELIEVMVTIFCDFVENNLLTWIMDRGGWMGMSETFKETESRTDLRVEILSRRFSKLLGPIAFSSALVCIGAAIFTLLAKYDISYMLSKII